MPLYFMHLRDGIDHVLDPDGVQMPFEAVPKATLAAARDCIAGDAHRGRIELKYWIDVEDPHGVIVHTLRFQDAVQVVLA